MKKGKNTPVRIHINPVPSPDGSVPFAGWFCLFFFCDLGFFLSCKEIHGSSASLFLCSVAILILSLYFTLWTAALGLDRKRAGFRFSGQFFFSCAADGAGIYQHLCACLPQRFYRTPV